MTIDQPAYHRSRTVSVVTDEFSKHGTHDDTDSKLSATMSMLRMSRAKLVNQIPWILRAAAVFTAMMCVAFVMTSVSPIASKSDIIDNWTLKKNLDVPYLLNVTAFMDGGQTAPASLLSRAAEEDGNSVAAAYMRLPYRCPTRPSASDLQAALRMIAGEADRRKSFAKRGRVKALRLAEQEDTLTVQLDLNGSESSDAIVQYIKKRASGFRYVLLVPPPRRSLSMASVVHSRAVSCLTKAAAHAARNTGARVKVFQAGPSMSGADDDALVLHAASHLVVHGGPRGALAALTTRGQAELGWNKGLKDFLDVDAFRWAVPALKGASARSSAEHLALNGMGNVSESCCEFEMFGTGDGSKVVCSNAHNFAQPPCWVLSLGCGNKWSFETDIVNRTQCSVQVYDCTSNYAVPAELQHRVTIHKLCIGRSSEEGGERTEYRSWADIIAIGASASGLPNDTMPTLAKIDVEGWEFPAFLDIAREGGLMPEQIVVELHASTNVEVGPPYEERIYNSGRYGVRKETYVELFANLSNAEYELVHRADNPFCGHCSEVTLLRRHAMPQRQPQT